MFEYFKAKRAEARFKAIIWGKITEVVMNLPDIVELANKAKNMDSNEVQKLIVDQLVSYVKNSNTTTGE